MSGATYPTWSAVAQAIRAAAEKAQQDRATPIELTTQIAQARHDRFLARVFSSPTADEWLLKGGNAMLARVPDTRATKDVDLAASTDDLDAAQQALAHIASQDLDDHLEFRLTRVRHTGNGDNQPGVQTRRLVFACIDLDKHREIARIPVDIVVGPPPVGAVQTVTPANRLTLARPLPAPPYRLFPVTDHIAEKVSATAQRYANGPSSRVKDLLDLVTFAETQRVSLAELHTAIESKRVHTRMDPIEQFTVPTEWESEYAAAAKLAPHTRPHPTLRSAEEFVGRLINPALRPPQNDATWSAEHGWVDADNDAQMDEAATPVDDKPVIVTPHVRAGQPVRGHRRSARGDRP